MSKNKTKKRSPRVGLDTKNFTDRWSAIQEDLKAIATEQVSADIELVEAQRALKLASDRMSKATSRKTTAEKRLTQLRANLGES
jgi:hypothetical protein